MPKIYISMPQSSFHHIEWRKQRWSTQPSKWWVMAAPHHLVVWCFLMARRQIFTRKIGFPILEYKLFVSHIRGKDPPPWAEEDILYSLGLSGATLRLPLNCVSAPQGYCCCHLWMTNKEREKRRLLSALQHKGYTV